MSTTLTLTANKSAAVAKVWGDANVHTGDVFDFPWYSDDSTYPDANYYIYLGFNAPSEAYKYRPILSAIFKCGAGKSLSYCQTFLKGLQQSFNEDSVNYSNQPAIDSTLQGSFHVGSYTTIEWNQTDLKPDGAALAAVYGLRLDCRVSRMSGASSAIARFASSRHAEKAPVIIATLGDSDVTAVVSPVSPAAGSFVNRAEKVSFMASVGNSAISFAALSAQSATLEYRTAGATAVTSKTAVVSSSGISYTAPANLFASGNYEYRFKIVDNLGRAAYSAWTAFTTADTIPVATPLSPDSSLEDGTQAITFRWTHSNESGSAQTKAELQKSADGSAWTTLGTVTGAANEYAAPAGTFTSGTWYWRVRTYNLDGAAGEWSTALSFVVVAGPTKPVIVVEDASPRPLINWQTSEQSAYQLQLDDIIDITDFDVVEYQYGVMRQTLLEEVATAILIGDGRDEADEHKISEEHVRSIWNDDDLYTIHYDVDIEAVRNELQGTGTASRFGENYIYAEAIITAALYSREKFKGTGTPDFFCTPHLVNVMLLARDTNGRRIYNSKADLAAALNINELHTAEQFEGLARTDKTGKKHNLLGIFVNLSDYTVGSTKGGEITRFNQFDIDFNQEKYLIETRLSGALTRLWSAIALEEPVKASSGQTEDAGHDDT